MNREQIYRLIDEERSRQAVKWSNQHEWGQGDCSSPDVHWMTKVAVLTEELGEVSRAILDMDPNNLIEELVQLAAVAVACLESEDFRND